MSGGYQIRDQEAIHYLTFQVVGWVDVFTRKRYKDIIVDSFEYCQIHKDLVIHSWVIMSNHIHCILSSKISKLLDTIRDFKRHTSKAILQSINEETESRREWMLQQFKFAALKHERNENYQFWTHENHPIELSGEMFDQRLAYIHNNPVEAGIVEHAEEYIYSSARDYTGIKGLIEIDNIE